MVLQLRSLSHADPEVDAVLTEENNFWTEVQPVQQQSMCFPGGADEPHSRRSLGLPAVGWLLVFVSFPSVSQSDNIVLVCVCTHVVDN